MISLQDFKDTITRRYKWGIDSWEHQIKARLDSLERQFTDEQLEEIINNSRLFAIDVINSETAKNGYASFPLNNDTTEFINLSGSWISEILFVDHKGRLISKTAVESVLGEDGEFGIKEEMYSIPSPDNPNGYSLGVKHSLYIQGFESYLESAREELIGRAKGIKDDKRE